MDEFLWVGMGCVVIGLAIGIAISFFAFHSLPVKILYRLQGDTTIKEGYIRDETDNQIKIGSIFRTKKLLLDGRPIKPDDAQWFEKSKVELLRIGRFQK